MTTKYGIRVVGTSDLLWGPDHLMKFKPLSEHTRQFDTAEAAETRLKAVVKAIKRQNLRYPDAVRPTALEVVRIITEVQALA